MATSQHYLADKSQTWKLFNKIAGRYDALNRILSLGIDVRWRKKVAKLVPSKAELRYVDLGTGTGDFIFAMIQRLGLTRFSSVIGIDPAENMLEIGKEKASKRHLNQKVDFQVGDATKLTTLSQTADVVTMSFAIRNVPSVRDCLSEIHRILDHEGRALILEFSLPRNPLIRWGYLFYFRHILPIIGGWFSGDRQAYRYLNESVEAFPYGEAFCQLMKDQGFVNVRQTPLSFGIATIYQGDKA